MSQDSGPPRRPGGSPNRRTTTRLAAIQALYQVEMSGLAETEVIQEFLELRLTENHDGLTLGQIDRGLFETLVHGTARQVSDLDDMLAAVLPESWPIERLERVLRIILRAAVWELSDGVETPARVVIKEYVDLAHAFFDGREPAMVNAILDRIAHLLRPEEFDDDPAALDSLPGVI